MELLWFLESVTVRSVCLAGIGLMSLWLFRIRSAAERHAMWTVVAMGMLSVAALKPILGPILILPNAAIDRVLVAEAPAVGRMTASDARVVASELSPSEFRTPWGQAAAGIYLTVTLILLFRLAFGYVFTLRLARRGRPVADLVYEADWVVVPMVIGWLNPKILLPPDWVLWKPYTLKAVLAHERAHIRRADWPISAMVAVNRCIFWFNPLAWWLQRRIAVLAEHACDDEALAATGDRQAYAEVLLKITAAARRSSGRLNWGLLTMSRTSNVRERIERILDETRRIPREVPARFWAILAGSGFAAVYLASSIQFAAHTTEQNTASSSVGRIDLAKAMLPYEEVERLERRLTDNPEDLESRSRLISHYLVTGMNDHRSRHVLWVIEHHPEADVLQIPTLFDTPGPLQDRNAFTRAAGLWRQQAAVKGNDPRVILNAAHFFLTSGDLLEAEAWTKRAGDLEPRNVSWRKSLAMLYSGALLACQGCPRLSSAAPDRMLAKHAREELLRSSDGLLLWHAGHLLQLSPEMIKENPEASDLAEYGKLLQDRALRLGYQPPEVPRTW
jgi:hypothetical protein